MKRRLVKQGTATLTISLPSPWIRKYDLKAGDEIELEERSGELILRSEKEANIEKSRIDITDLPASLVLRSILSAYKKGSDEINVIFRNNTLRNKKTQKTLNTARYVQEIVNNLVGMEVIDQGKNTIKIKQISEVSAEEFDNILRRIFLLLLSMGEDAAELAANPGSDQSILANKHDSIDKFVNYSIRLLNRRGYFDFRKTSIYYYIVQELEEISDVYMFSTKEVLANRWKLNKESLQLLGLTNDTLRMFYELFYKFDRKMMVKILDSRREFWNRVNVFSKKHFSDNIFLARLANIHLRLLNLCESRMSLE